MKRLFLLNYVVIHYVKNYAALCLSPPVMASVMQSKKGVFDESRFLV